MKCASFICSKFSLLLKYNPRSIYQNSNLTQRLSQLIFLLGLVFFVELRADEVLTKLLFSP